jgi:hypothetical protein
MALFSRPVGHFPVSCLLGFGLESRDVPTSRRERSRLVSLRYGSTLHSAAPVPIEYLPALIETSSPSPTRHTSKQTLYSPNLPRSASPDKHSKIPRWIHCRLMNHQSQSPRRKQSTVHRQPTVHQQNSPPAVESPPAADSPSAGDVSLESIESD